MTDNDNRHYVVATIWEHIEPINRGDRYEDPLYDAINGIGDVVGGGSQFNRATGIEYVNIEIELASLNSIPLVKSTLEAQGVPKGSELRYTKDDADVVDEFGVTECVAVFLDGVGLPDSVYENADIDQIADRITDALMGAGEIRASFAGETETSILIFGNDAEDVYARIEDVLLDVPLCQNARVVLRHGKPSLEPREFRLPFHAT